MSRYRTALLFLIVFISGLIQGALIPLLSTLLEREGVPAWLNGVNAIMLYIGIIASAPLLEHYVRRFGFRPSIMFGISLTAFATILLPVLPTLFMWALLRFLIGVGDSSLHYGSQVWVTASTPKQKLGRYMAYYGMSYSLGFAIGPMLAPLVDVSFWLPFIVIVLLCMLAFLLLLRIRNEHPDTHDTPDAAKGRIALILTGASYTLLPAFTYGFLEASLNANLPIFTSRNALSLTQTSTLITTFIVASIVIQLPLGRLADHFGKKIVLQTVLVLGTVLFLAATFFGSNYPVLLVLFALTGAGLGSTYSLGLAHMTEVLPRSLLPTGNMLYNISFSVGSISGPLIGAAWLELPASWYFIMYALVLGLISVSLATGRVTLQNEN